MRVGIGNFCKEMHAPEAVVVVVIGKIDGWGVRSVHSLSFSISIDTIDRELLSDITLY